MKAEGKGKGRKECPLRPLKLQYASSAFRLNIVGAAATHLGFFARHGGRGGEGRGGLGRASLDLVIYTIFSGGLGLELADALAERATDFWQLADAENDHDDDQHDCQLRNANAAHGVFPPRGLVAVQLLAIVERRRLDRFVQLAARRIVRLPKAGFQCANGRMVTHHTREHDCLT